MEKVDYKQLQKETKSLMDGVSYLVSNLSNISALLKEKLPYVNWVGFYLIEDNKLILGPFQGKVACTQIAIGKGVCGTAVQLNQTLIVNDVSKFPGHIACDTSSNSEIVIPIHDKEKVFGVLDIDSQILNRFNQEDEEGLLSIVELIEERLNKHLDK